MGEVVRSKRQCLPITHNDVQLSMRVKNPHIVDVIDCEIDMSSGQPQVWLVSEFCDKGDLFVRLKQLRNIHMIMPRAVRRYIGVARARV